MQTFFQRVLKNLRPGITVGLISLPLSIALSIASGAGPIPGIITGIWAPIMASVFGSSRYNVIGVAGALTAVLFSASLEHGPMYLPFIALFSGLMIIGIYLLRLDRYLRYVPSSVIYGFATGVAVLIAVNQLFDAVGLTFIKRNGEFFADLVLLVQSLPQASIASFLVAMGTLTFLILHKKYVKFLPGVIPAVIIGSLIGALGEFHIIKTLDLITLEDTFGRISAQIFQLPSLDSFTSIFSDTNIFEWLLKTSLVVAIISVLETLITARIGDKLTKTEHDSKKELRGLGIANIVSGILGGLPATGVFIRTGVNIKAGASSSMSQGIAGVVTVILALLAWPIFQYIPMAVIAGILMMTAIGLIETKHFVRYWKLEKSSLFVGASVAVITLVGDALIAVLVGVVIALVIFIEKITNGRCDVSFNVNKQKIKDDEIKEFHVPSEHQPDVVIYSIAGFLAYADSVHHRDHLKTLAATASLQTVIIRMRDLHYVDLDGVETLTEGIEFLQKENKHIIFCSVNNEVLEGLKTNIFLSAFLASHPVYPNTEKALASLGFSEKDLQRETPIFIEGTSEC